MWALSLSELGPRPCSFRRTAPQPERHARPHTVTTSPHVNSLVRNKRNAIQISEAFHSRCLASRFTPRPLLACASAAGPSCVEALAEASGSGAADPRAARLKAWVLEHSKTLPTQLTPVQRSDGSYSLVADEPVRRGQILVRVPRRLLMSQDTARASEACGRTVREAGLNEWQSLILHLLCERALGSRSFWAPYLDTLPQDMSFHPLLWGPDRLTWLRGSPLTATLEQRQSQVLEDTEALLVAGANDLAVAAEHRMNTGSELVTSASVGWAAAVLLSRCFRLDLDEEEPLAGDMGYWGTWGGHCEEVLVLVPWADCLGHCSEAGPESCARYQSELGEVTLSAHRSYRVGERVADSHGPHLSPVDLFLDFGMEEQPPQPQPPQPQPPQQTTVQPQPPQAFVSNSFSSSSSSGATTGPTTTHHPPALSQQEAQTAEPHPSQAPVGVSEAVVVAEAGEAGVGDRAPSVVHGHHQHEGQQQLQPQHEGATGSGSESESGSRSGSSSSLGWGWWQRHRFDADPGEVAAPRSARNKALLSALAAVQGEGCRLALGEEGPDTASLTYLRAALAPDVELVRAGWRLKATDRDVELACRVMGSLALPSSAATEGALLAALGAYVEAALARFPTSLEQDLARLEGREGVERVVGPERLALVALASQKKALLGTAKAVASWRAKLAAGCPVGELYDDEYDETYDDEYWAEDGDGEAD